MDTPTKTEPGSSFDGTSEHRHRPRLLFVDDEPRVLKMIARTQSNSNWELFFAESGAQGLEVLEREEIDVVVSDMKMPEMSGVEFLSEVTRRHPEIVSVLLTGYSDLEETTDAINKGHIYSYIAKGGSDFDFKMTIFKALQYRRNEDEKRHLRHTIAARNEELKQINERLTEVVADRTQALQETLDNVKQRQAELEAAYATSVKLFSHLIELRGRQSGHGHRVAKLAGRLAGKLSIEPEIKEQLSVAAVLHDIGKVCFTDRQLTHSYDELTESEQFDYRKHAAMGSALLMSLKPYRTAARMIRHHHEAYDGTGYPDQLAGNEIPLGSRVIAVCSDYDELTRGNGTPDAETSEFALATIEAGAGSRYDPKVVAKLGLVLQESAEIEVRSEIELTSEELNCRVVLARDLTTQDGIVLVNKQEQLDEQLIERIRQFEKETGESLRITAYRTYGT